MPSALNQKFTPSSRAAQVTDGANKKVNVAVVLFIPKTGSDGDVVNNAAPTMPTTTAETMTTTKQAMARL
ncbi:MAG: hypothetical protein ACQCN6_10645 [Candidatus Bathyarchaeia archaeon]